MDHNCDSRLLLWLDSESCLNRYNFDICSVITMFIHMALIRKIIFELLGFRLQTGFMILWSRNLGVLFIIYW